MENIIRKIINIDKIKELLNKKWYDIIKNIRPNKNKSLVKDNEYNDVYDGSILITIGSSFSVVFNAILSSFALVKNGLFVGSFGQTAFIEALSSQTFSIIIGLIGAILLPSLIFSFNRYAKEKEQTSLIYLIIAIYAACGIIGIAFNIISTFINLFINPLIAILLFAFLAISFMGYVYLLNGSVDFCQRCNKNK